jgi:hypothetical protein
MRWIDIVKQGECTTEAFAGAFQTRGETCEVFRNPNSREFRECGGEIRAFLVGSDILMWNAYGALHQEVRERMKLPRDIISLEIYSEGYGGDVFVNVTDNTERTSWYHNPEIVDEIKSHPGLNRMFKDIDIGYFDEAIVGPWDEIRAEELTERAPAVPKLSDKERADLLVFLSKWYGGSYMVRGRVTRNMAEAVSVWERFHTLFPHGLSGPQKLYRVVTLPISYAKQTQFHLPAPALAPVSSWAMKKTGMMFAAGIAKEFHASSKTCRVGIEATFDASDILADATTVRRTVMALMKDFPWSDGEDDPSLMWSGKTFQEWDSKHDIGYMWGNFEMSRGGYYNQWECIVRTQPVDCRVVKVFRVGDNTLDHGWEF